MTDKQPEALIRAEELEQIGAESSLARAMAAHTIRLLLLYKENEALRARLAQPKPEPQETIDKWIKANTEHREWYICPKCSYQAPRFKDEWQGLTDEEINDHWINAMWNTEGTRLPIPEFARAIEAKLKEKNAPDL